MSASEPFQKNKILSHHIHIFREGLLEYRVCTPSEKWCWKTFLQDGISEYPILGFVSVIKNKKNRPPIVKLFVSDLFVYGKAVQKN